MPYLFTSESVSEGHPDKVADQISDALSNIGNERTISDEQKTKIVETLKSLYQQPFLNDGSQES